MPGMTATQYAARNLAETKSAWADAQRTGVGIVQAALALKSARTELDTCRERRSRLRRNR